MRKTFMDTLSDRVTTWVGSTASVIVHTFLFAFVFVSPWIFGWSFDFVLLVLTTVVSLEAIYISIFIQRAVNQQAARLEDVEESIDDMEESIDDMEESIDDMEESIDDMEEALDEVLEEEGEESAPSDVPQKREEPLDEVVLEMRKLLKELKATMKQQEKEKVPAKKK